MRGRAELRAFFFSSLVKPGPLLFAGGIQGGEGKAAAPCSAWEVLAGRVASLSYDQ